MDVRIAGTAKPASCLPTEIVPPLNSPTANALFGLSNRPIWSERVSTKQGAGVTKTRKAL